METLKEKWSEPLTVVELQRLGFSVHYKRNGAFDHAYIPDPLRKPMGIPEFTLYALPSPADLFMWACDAQKKETKAVIAERITRETANLTA